MLTALLPVSRMSGQLEACQRPRGYGSDIREFALTIISLGAFTSRKQDRQRQEVSTVNNDIEMLKDLNCLKVKSYKCSG